MTNCLLLADIFALYILSRSSRLSNVCENIYLVEFFFIMLHRCNSIKNAKINPRQIANFRECAKIYTCKNIYVHSKLCSIGHYSPHGNRYSYTQTDNVFYAEVVNPDVHLRLFKRGEIGIGGRYREIILVELASDH